MQLITFFVICFPHLCSPSLCISFECYPSVVCTCITFLFTLSLSPSLSLLSETTVAVEKRRNIETLCMNRASFLQETQTVFLASKVQNNLGPSGPPSVQLWLTHMHSHLHGVIQACLSISRKTLAFSSQWTKASVCTLVQWMLTLANAFVLALENSCSSMCVAKSER